MPSEVNCLLAVAAFLSTLLAGLLLAFAMLVMPGLGRLEDREFITAFREIDGIIQRGHPLFVLIWLGSGLTLVGGFALAATKGVFPELFLIGAAILVHGVGIQLPTLRINIPLNNRLQALDLDAMDEEACRLARGQFESLWNRWNRVRTILATTAAAMIWTAIL
ncbi:MAG: DUF1772 domain-containing protein [Gemmatimonadota bacterium]|nr:DUF1772 domain-containing protein [Gemmatimonadota bacterium]